MPEHGVISSVFHTDLDVDRRTAFSSAVVEGHFVAKMREAVGNVRMTTLGE